MAKRSKYTYDDFVTAAAAAGLASDFDDRDLAQARINPDAAMTLLGYKQDYADAMRSGNDTAAYLAEDGMNKIRAGYETLPPGDTSSSFGAPADAGSMLGTNLPSAFKPKPLKPQANPSSEYTMKDAQAIMRGVASGTGSGVDANGDSSVNVKDASYILRRIAGYDDGGARAEPSAPLDLNKEYDALLSDYIRGGVDVEGSNLWKSYAKAYNREGQRAQDSVLDKYAAANGGELSSYAQSAAAQQRNYYMSQLMDKYPEIYAQLRTEQADGLSALLGAMGQKKEDALLAAQYGDYDALKSLGIDPSRFIAEEEYKKKAQEALYAAQYGDYRLLDAMFGTNAAAAAEREERLAALKVALGYGDASGFDAQYGTSIGDVLAGASEAEKEQAALDRAYTLAKLGIYDELAALTGKSVAEISGAVDQVTSASSSVAGNASGAASVEKSIPTALKSEAKSLKGDNYALYDLLLPFVEIGEITETEADYIMALYGMDYTNRDQAIKAGAPEETWTEDVYNHAKSSYGDVYAELPDTYGEYLSYMVSKGRKSI